MIMGIRLASVLCWVTSVCSAAPQPVAMSFNKPYPLNLPPGGTVQFNNDEIATWLRGYTSVIALININTNLKLINTSFTFDYSPSWFVNQTHNCASCGVELGLSLYCRKSIQILIGTGTTTDGLVGQVEFVLRRYPRQPQQNVSLGLYTYKFTSFSDAYNLYFKLTPEGLGKATRGLLRLARTEQRCQSGIRVVYSIYPFGDEGMDYSCTFTTGPGNVEFPITFDYKAGDFPTNGYGVDLMIVADPNMNETCLRDFEMSLDIKFSYDDVMETQLLNYSSPQEFISSGYFLKRRRPSCSSPIVVPCFKLPDPSLGAVASILISPLLEECAVSMNQVPPLWLLGQMNCRDGITERYNLSECDTAFASATSSGTVLCLINTGVVDPSKDLESPPQYCNGSMLIEALEYKPPIYDLEWDDEYFSFLPNRTWKSEYNNIMSMRFPAVPDLMPIYSYNFFANCYGWGGAIYLKSGNVPANEWGDDKSLKCSMGSKLEAQEESLIRFGVPENYNDYCYDNIQNEYTASWCCRGISLDKPLYATAHMSVSGTYEYSFKGKLSQAPLLRHGSDTLAVVNSTACPSWDSYVLLPGVTFTGNMSVSAVFGSNGPWEGSTWAQAAEIRIYPSQRPVSCGTSLFAANDIDNNGYGKPPDWSEPIVIDGVLPTDEFTAQGIVAHIVVSSYPYGVCSGPIDATVKISLAELNGQSLG